MTGHLWEAFLGTCTCGSSCSTGDAFKAHLDDVEPGWRTR